MLTMYDSIDVRAIPADAAAVAGYVGGHWPTFPQLLKTHPHAHHLSIAVTAAEDADVLDIERGDATPDQAGAWAKRQHDRGVSRPCLYASVSSMPAVLANLTAHGILREHVRLWTAHYTGRPHLCSSVCGFGFRDHADATQYVNHGQHGENVDLSLCADDFFTPGPSWKTPPPAPAPARPKIPPVHPKTTGAAAGGLSGVALGAILSAAHVHLTQPEIAAVAAILSALGAALAKKTAT